MVKLRRIDENETLHDPTEDLEAKSLLGAEVMRQFRAALFSKKSQRVGEYSLHELITFV